MDSTRTGTVAAGFCTYSVSQTAIMQEVYPAGFNRGFTETFSRYGVLLDRLAMGVVNGFTYHQPQPFDMPGPDGPKSEDEIQAEFGSGSASLQRHSKRSCGARISLTGTPSGSRGRLPATASWATCRSAISMTRRSSSISTSSPPM